MGLVLVTALLLLQFSFFPARSMAFQYYGKNWPWMKLPVATNQTHCCRCFFGDELSWTKTGGWVGREGSIQPEKMEGLFREGIERGMGRRYTLRLRIPADAAAGKFTETAMAAQRAGVSCLHVAVVDGKRG